MRRLPFTLEWAWRDRVRRPAGAQARRDVAQKTHLLPVVRRRAGAPVHAPCGDSRAARDPRQRADMEGEYGWRSRTGPQHGVAEQACGRGGHATAPFHDVSRFRRWRARWRPPEGAKRDLSKLRERVGRSSWTGPRGRGEARAPAVRSRRPGSPPPRSRTGARRTAPRLGPGPRPWRPGTARPCSLRREDARQGSSAMYWSTRRGAVGGEAVEQTCTARRPACR